MRIAFTHNRQVSDDEAEAEFDTPETIAALADAMRRLGHEVHEVDVGAPVAEIVVRLERLRPDLVFNTAEGRTGPCREAFFPQLFEELGLVYTGPDAHACTLTLDKHLSKLLVRQVGVPTPMWVKVQTAADLDRVPLPTPVIAKPIFEGSSKGIGEHSVYEDLDRLRKALPRLLAAHPDGLMVEQYIVGRDVVVPFLAGAAPEREGVLAPAAYRFDPEIVGARKYVVYDYALKHELSNAVHVEMPAVLPPGVTERLQAHAATVNRVLGLRDMGRLDFRVDPQGDVWFIEANALPSLEPGASIYEAAALEGLDTVEAVLDRIIRSADARRPRAPLAPSTPAPARVGLIYNLKRLRPKADGADDAEAEFDAPATIDALAAAIASHGHEVVRLEADAEVITRLGAARIDVAFNIAEGLRGRGREALVPAALEMLDIPYTGSDPATLALTLDKALAKSVVRDAGVAAPRGVVLQRADGPLPDWIRYPVIAKPVAEGSSKGVSLTSVARSEDGLRRIVAEMLDRYRQGVLVEQFLPGREFTVGLVGDPMPRILGPMEIVFTGDVEHPVYSFAHKIEADTNVRYEAPAKVDAALGEAIRSVALRAFEALGCRDVARIDLRLDAEGEVNFIECNPLPGMTPGWSDLCICAKGEGISYEELVGLVLEPALVRLQTQRMGR
ncbi:MAG: D-alanine--D-alanine ligase [Myxococcales bacterium]|nr:D-alanine--D-alanine ligase [Myxococcales bacterium]